MLSVERIYFTPIYTNNSIAISIKIKDTYEKLNDFFIQIEKSLSGGDDFLTICSDLTTMYYIDTDVDLYNIAMNFYYRVKIINKATGEIYISDIFELRNSTQIDEYGFYFAAAQERYLDILDMPTAKLLKRKHSGELCTCYDDVRETSRNTNCLLCFGVKYSGGYYDSIDIKINYLAPPGLGEDFNISDVHEEESPLKVWTVGFPTISVDDVLIDKGKFYIVTRVNPSIKNGYMFRQTLDIIKIPESNIIYQMKI